MTELKLKSTYITQTSSARLYGLSIPIIGLTGGIATGKSSVSKILLSQDFPVIDADKLVHQIYAKGETISFIESMAPSCVKDKVIDFKALRTLFFSHREIQSQIEAFIYKELPHTFNKALQDLKKPSFIIYDVPLLFEKKLNKLLDASVTVYCDQKTQLQRLILRDGTTPELAQKVLDKQLPIDKKRELSDYVIDNTGDLTHLKSQVDTFISSYFE